MKKYSKVWVVTAIVAMFASVWFLWPWISVVVLSALMAFIFYPVYERLRRKKGHVAALMSLIASFLVVLIPVFIIVIAATSQLFNFAEMANKYDYWNKLPELAKDTIQIINETIEPITGMRSSISEQGITDYLRSAIPAVARTSVNVLIGAMISLPAVGISLLLYSLLFMEFIKNGPMIIRAIKKISPFPTDVTNKYITQTGAMANAMVKGQLMIAFIIALLASLLLLLIGYDSYFFIFLILFTILNFVPLGCGIVVIPLALYAMITGQLWLGLIVLILYYFVGYLDPILRPRFVPKSVSLSTPWIVLGTFCGIAYFGILGVVYGPILMMLIIHTWKFYMDTKSAATRT